jgi:hypothetical protein
MVNRRGLLLLCVVMQGCVGTSSPWAIPDDGDGGELESFDGGVSASGDSGTSAALDSGSLYVSDSGVEPPRDSGIPPAVDAGAMPWDEYRLIRSMPAYPWSRAAGGAPNSDGLVGGNQASSAFNPDLQRGAMDALVVGLALKGRGPLSDEVCDRYIEGGMLAIRTTYALQTRAGDFSTQSNTVTASGGGANAMHFFMAWSNHALVLMTKSPEAARYQTEINALRPQVQRAMDYLVQKGSPDFTDSTSEMHHDWGSANRSMINASAFAMGHLFLSGFAPQANLDAYWSRMLGWLANEFENPNPYIGQIPLFRDIDGLFLEKPPRSAVAGYDTSYRAVGNRFFLSILVSYPDAVMGGLDKAARAGRWLERRILADPMDSSRGLVDCTNNTRSGVGNQEVTLNPDAALKAVDRNSLLPALMYHAAMFNHPASNVAAERVARSTVGQSEVTSRPPTVFSPNSARVRRGDRVSFPVMATNAGLDSVDPQFELRVTGLPAWLSVGTLQHLKSTGLRMLTGTVPPDASLGPVVISVQAKNASGSGTVETLTFDVTAP